MASRSTRTVRPADAEELSPKEQLFVAAYTARFNGAWAAREAGYSVKTAKHIAHQLLERPPIQTAVAAILEARKAAYAVTVDRVLQTLAYHAFSDIRHYVDPDNAFIPLTHLDDAAAAAIGGFEIGYTSGTRGRKGRKRTRERVVKLKLVDKAPALELLAKHLGIAAGGQEPPTGPSIIFPPGTRIAIELEP